MGPVQQAQSFYKAKATLHYAEKAAVALWIVSRLGEGEAVLIDAGTSLTPVAQIISMLAALDPDRTHYTIMTHNYGAFNFLVPSTAGAHLNVFLTGGRYDEDLKALFGEQAQAAYADFCPRWVLIGQSGLDASIGLFCHGNTEEMALKQQIFDKPTDSRLIVSDWSKFGSMGGLCFGPAERLGLNAKQCIVLTGAPSHKEPREAREHFEAQCGLLNEIHGVKVEVVHYEVEPRTNEDVRPRVSTITESSSGWRVDLLEDQRDTGEVATLRNLNTE
jgi:DeoR/GlpR family transcriptional regulator of sugar metabolism